MSCFKGDLDFCPECGNILPVPGKENTITCPRCSFEISVEGKRDLFNVIKCNLWQGFLNCYSWPARGKFREKQCKINNYNNI